MAAVVFVWNDNLLGGQPGHASLSIEGGVYVSYYPDPKATKMEIVLKGAPSASNYSKRVAGSAQAIVFSATMAMDTHNFRRMPSFASKPILGLDEERMTQWWLTNRTNRYSLLRNSCADMVVRTLDIGGAASRSMVAKGIMLAAKFNYVLPRDCIYLAKSIGG